MIIGDDDDSEFYCKLISAVHDRPPLWDSRIPIKARHEPIKQNLWNEIYVELQGL